MLKSCGYKITNPWTNPQLAGALSTGFGLLPNLMEDKQQPYAWPGLRFAQIMYPVFKTDLTLRLAGFSTIYTGPIIISNKI